MHGEGGRRRRGREKLTGRARMLWMAAAGFSSFFLTLASLPAWIASRGGSATSAGAATTVMLAATVVVQPLVPGLLRRRTTSVAVAIGLVGLGIPTPLLLLAPSGAGLYGVCAVRGAGFAVFTVAGTLMISEVAPPGREGEVAGLYGLAAAVPNVVVVPGAVLILHEIGFWPVAILAALPALAGLLAERGCRPGGAIKSFSAAEEPGRHGVDEPARRLPDGRPALAGLLAPAGVLCAVTILGGAVLTILPIERPGWVATVGLLVFASTSALTRWQVGVRVDRHHSAWLLAAACAAAAAGAIVLGVGLTGSPGSIPLIACAVIGGAYGAVQCLTLVFAFARVSAPRRPLASAVWNTAFDAGTGIGATLVGALTATALGLSGAFAVLAGLVAFTIPAGISAARRPAATR